MKRAKAEGRIAKIPCGRIPGRRKGEPIEVSRARAMVKQEVANLPARMERPFAELEPPEMLDALTPKALCKMAEILDLPTDLVSLGGDKMMQHRLYRRSEEHTSELQSHVNLVCRLLLEKKKNKKK